MSTGLLSLAFLPAAACSSTRDATQIIAVVYTNLIPGEQLTRVKVRIVDPETQFASSVPERAVRSDREWIIAGRRSGETPALTFPFSFAIAPPSEDQLRDFRIVVTGYGPLGEDGAEIAVVEQMAKLGYRRHEKLLLEIFLWSTCLKQLCKEEREAGQDSACMLATGRCGEVPTLRALRRAGDDPIRVGARPELGPPAAPGGGGTGGLGGEAGAAGTNGPSAEGAAGGATAGSSGSGVLGSAGAAGTGVRGGMNVSPPGSSGSAAPGGSGSAPTAGSGSTPTAGSGGSQSTIDDGVPTIPAVEGTCPAFVNGIISFGGLSGIHLQAGSKTEAATAPFLAYWHAEDSVAGDYAVLAGPVHDGVMAEGGVVVSFEDSSMVGDASCSGLGTFSLGDLDIVDQLVACAVRDHSVDPHRIYTTGCSAGGLFAACMAARRSSYVAAAAPNSGGWALLQPWESEYTPALMTMHGASGVDMVIVDYATTSATADMAFKMRGGFVINCNHGGGRCQAHDLADDVWEFFKAHRYGTEPHPWANGLPTDFADACSIY